MSREPGLSCARMRVLVEPHLDGTLASRWRSRVELHLAGCADCRADVETARHLGQELRRLPRLEFPAARFAAVMTQVQDDEATRAARSADGAWSRLRRQLAAWGEAWSAGHAWRPVMATAAVAVAAVAVLLVLRQAPSRPSQAELAHAERQALLALAYVIQVTHGTSHDALSVTVSGVVDEVARVENVMGTVGVVVADQAAEHIVEPLVYPARVTDRREQPPRSEARVDTIQQEERQ